MTSLIKLKQLLIFLLKQTRN